MYDKTLLKRPDTMEQIFVDINPELQELDNVEIYYLSWLLRGNSPTFGADMKDYSLLPKGIDRQWVDAGMNHHIGVEIACQNACARNLYDMYHSKEFAINNALVDSFIVPSIYREDYYELLERIQEDLMSKIERKHIAIECNPSSNYKIGEIDRYDQHPILRFLITE